VRAGGGPLKGLAGLGRVIKVMRVSLKRLLATGEFGDLHAGVTDEQVLQRLGEPDEVGGASRRYPRAWRYYYGNVQLCFDRQAANVLLGVIWNAVEDGGFRVPCTWVVEDWDLTPEMGFEQVEEYLRSIGVGLVHGPLVNGVPLLVLPHAVEIAFNRERRLAMIYAPPPSGPPFERSSVKQVMFRRPFGAE
jgi:hypothetical protein